MARASQASAKKDKEDDAPAAGAAVESPERDSPLLDLSDAAVKKLIKAGKAAGYVTIDQLNAVLPSEEVTSEQIEDTMAMLSDMGITVVEAEEGEEEEAAEEPGEEEESRAPTFTLRAGAPQTALRSPSAASAQAIAASTLPAAATIAARDLEVAEAVASIEPDHAPHPVAAAAAPATTAGHQPVTVAASRPWQPSPLLWQQLLVALGVLSVGTLGWRTRLRTSLPRPRAAAGSAATAHAATRPPSGSRAADTISRTATGHNAMGRNATGRGAAVIALPNLPQSPVTRTMDEWQAEAEAAVERYEYSAAETAYRHLLSGRETAFGAADARTALAETQLADCLREQGRYAAAEPHYLRALATLAAAVGETHPSTGDCLENYAVCLLNQGRAADAEHVARQVLPIRRARGLLSREHAICCSILAEALRALGRLAQADTEHRLAWSQFIAVCGQDSPEAATSMISIGTLMAEQHQFAPAEELLNAGTRILASVCGPDHPASASGYAMLGSLYRLAGATGPAATMLAHALSIRERTLGERHPDTIETVLGLALLASIADRMPEAQTYLDRAMAALLACERNVLGPQSRIRILLATLSQRLDITAQVWPLAAE